jgi:hypothetical protein
MGAANGRGARVLPADVVALLPQAQVVVDVERFDENASALLGA